MANKKPAVKFGSYQKPQRLPQSNALADARKDLDRYTHNQSFKKTSSKFTK
jgi:hypothetical protein